MRLLSWTLLALLGAVGSSSSKNIDHVVVLMLENRSFDHMLGFLKQDRPELDGCLPDMPECSCPVDPLDPTSQRFPVTDQAPYRNVNPGHQVINSSQQIYGYGPLDTFPAPMSGFIKNYAANEKIMDGFSKEHVPAISTLAEEFATVDCWFSSVPGPTEVNRMYAMSATSHGSGTNDHDKIALGYPQRSIFESIDESKTGSTWGVYFVDSSTSWIFKYNRRPENLLKAKSMRAFYEDAKAGHLPNFTWVEPRWYDTTDPEPLPSQDQHPDHDVAEGDLLIKNVYEALRNGPLWSKTLLLVVYDEHGGFFDHVAPPTNAQNPDGLIANDVDPPFAFDRLGVRVPAVLVSPWIQKGLIVSKDGTAGPRPPADYEHASIPATLRKLFAPDQAPLTVRDSWAKTFDWVVGTSEEMRTDCPTTLPAAKSHRALNPELVSLEKLGTTPISDLQESLIKMTSALETGRVTQDGRGFTEEKAYTYVREVTNRFLGRHVVE